jgi:hypothetical protein
MAGAGPLGCRSSDEDGGWSASDTLTSTAADTSGAFKRRQLGPEHIFDLPRVGCSQTILGVP